MEVEHCRTGASGAYRWLACPGSLALEDFYANVSSVFADEGTLAHSLLERCLNTGDDPKQYIGWNQVDFDLEEELDSER